MPTQIDRTAAADDTEVTEVEADEAAVETIEATVEKPEADEADEADEPDEADSAKSDDVTRRINWTRVLAYGVVPALALLLAMAAGFLKWEDGSAGNAEIARAESLQAAKDSTIALLSYQPDTIEAQLGTVSELLTGEYKNYFTSYTTDAIIPLVQQDQIRSETTIAAAAPVSADPNHAVAMLFVNRTYTAPGKPTTNTANSVRVTMEKIDGRWLISGFDPV